MHFFKVDISAEIEGDLDSHTLYLQSESPNLMQHQVEDYIQQQLQECTQAWCRELYMALLQSLRNVESEHNEPMSLVGLHHQESNHPVWCGRNKRFLGSVNFKRLIFDTV